MSRLLASGLAPAAVRRLRDAGLEVVFLDEQLPPEVVVAIAEQEDVAAVAVGDAEHGAAVAHLWGEALDQHAVVFWIT